MNYRGAVLRPEHIDADRAGVVIKAALSDLYRNEGRFLGGHVFHHAFGRYEDLSEGDVLGFVGTEQILVGGLTTYRLHYHGGQIVP
jgi:hypothetical protein